MNNLKDFKADVNRMISFWKKAEFIPYKSVPNSEIKNYTNDDSVESIDTFVIDCIGIVKIHLKSGVSMLWWAYGDKEVIEENIGLTIPDLTYDMISTIVNNDITTRSIHFTKDINDPEKFREIFIDDFKKYNYLSFIDNDYYWSEN